MSSSLLLLLLFLLSNPNIFSVSARSLQAFSPPLFNGQLTRLTTFLMITSFPQKTESNIFQMELLHNIMHSKLTTVYIHKAMPHCE
jgi:hypothetical protein